MMTREVISRLVILTGEDIYRIEDFETLCREDAVDKIHPDLATSGGILQTHRIGDMAFKYGVPMAMHFAGTPVSCMANVHCAAATRNFLALENHSPTCRFGRTWSPASKS
jgi:L-alanine-DL-glutamate epimerase-like enolase superfamily enzyme